MEKEYCRKRIRDPCYVSLGSIGRGKGWGPKLIKRNDGFQLYNVEVDISEEYCLSEQQPKNVERLRNMMQEFEVVYIRYDVFPLNK